MTCGVDADVDVCVWLTQDTLNSTESAEHDDTMSITLHVSLVQQVLAAWCWRRNIAGWERHDRTEVTIVCMVLALLPARADHHFKVSDLRLGEHCMIPCCTFLSTYHNAGGALPQPPARLGGGDHTHQHAQTWNCSLSQHVKIRAGWYAIGMVFVRWQNFELFLFPVNCSRVDLWAVYAFLCRGCGTCCSCSTVVRLSLFCKHSVPFCVVAMFTNPFM